MPGIFREGDIEIVLARLRYLAERRHGIPAPQARELVERVVLDYQRAVAPGTRERAGALIVLFREACRRHRMQEAPARPAPAARRR